MLSSLCLAAVAFYTLGVVWTAKAPVVVRCRALARAISYFANFMITYAPRMIQVWLPPRFGGPFSKYFSIFSVVLLCLNGAGNVGIYAFWMKRVAIADDRVIVGSVLTAFGEPRTVVNDFEQLR